MIRSMTAFTRQEQTASWGTIILELRSVNHRYLDMSFRLPDELRMLEGKLRERLVSRLGRGKLDCTVRLQREIQADTDLTVNTALAKQIAHASREIDLLLYNPAPVQSMDVLRWPGVLQAAEVDQDLLQAALFNVLDNGLDELISMREREGEKLAELIRQRCEMMEKIVTDLGEHIPDIMQSWRDKLVARLQEIKSELDEARLEQEMVYMAQKTDVAEELDRLRTHLTEVQRILNEGKPVGRRLDFLMQELNREANTLGSKSINSATTQASVELKVLIEQMREQVQNIE